MRKINNFFRDLGLRSNIINALESIGYIKPFPIQIKCIPLLLQGYDVIGMAQTGSGKTAAFLLPLLQNIDVRQSVIQGLIIVPTRELAIQIGQVLIKFIRCVKNIKVTTIYGGQNYSIQLTDLKKNPHIVVSTPGRLLDYLNKGIVNVSQVKFLVIDEADEMFRMGFIEDMERIIDFVPKRRQTALFSATLSVDIKKISYKLMREPKEIFICRGINNICSDINQNYCLVNGFSKHEVLMRFLEIEDFNAVLVFVRTKIATVQISEILKRFGYNSAALNGDMSQLARNQTISCLRSGSLDILITTDVAARGLDIDRINLVINYDVPSNYDSYVHRIGRTGRAGNLGKSFLFVESQEYYLFKNIKRRLHNHILEIPCPTSHDLINNRLVKLSHEISKQVDSADIETYKSLLKRIKLNENLTMETLAAVLLKISRYHRPLVLPPDPIIRKKKIFRYKMYFKKKNNKEIKKYTSLGIRK